MWYINVLPYAYKIWTLSILFRILTPAGTHTRIFFMPIEDTQIFISGKFKIYDQSCSSFNVPKYHFQALKVYISTKIPDL